MAEVTEGNPIRFIVDRNIHFGPLTLELELTVTAPTGLVSGTSPESVTFSGTSLRADVIINTADNSIREGPRNVSVEIRPSAKYGTHPSRPSATVSVKDDNDQPEMLVALELEGGGRVEEDIGRAAVKVVVTDNLRVRLQNLAEVTVRFDTSTLSLLTESLPQESLTGTARVTTVPMLTSPGDAIEVKLAATEGLTLDPNTVTLTNGKPEGLFVVEASRPTATGSVGSVTIESAVSSEVITMVETGQEFGVLEVAVVLVTKLRGVVITSDPGTDEAYITGDKIEVTVTFDKVVAVVGTPQVSLDVGGTTKTADYSGDGSLSSTQTFSYMVAEGDMDADGIEIVANGLDLNGGVFLDRFGHATAISLMYLGQGPFRRHKVEDVVLTVESVTVTSDPGTDETYITGDKIEVTVTFSEMVTVVGTPQVSLDVGGTTKTAGYSGDSSLSSTQTFSYTVAEGDMDADGIEIVANGLDLNGGMIADVIGQAATASSLRYTRRGPFRGHKVDPTVPTADVSIFAFTVDEASTAASMSTVLLINASTPESDRVVDHAVIVNDSVVVDNPGVENKVAELFSRVAVEIVSGVSAGADVKLVYTLRPHRHGTYRFSVELGDSGGGGRVTFGPFTLTVNPVDNPPTLDPSAPLFIDEDSTGTITIAAFAVSAASVIDDGSTRTITLTGISNGPDEEPVSPGNPLTLSASITGFSADTEVQWNGLNILDRSIELTGEEDLTLTVVGGADVNGESTITFVLTDGANDSGATTDKARSFVREVPLIIAPVNDAPVLVPVPGARFSLVSGQSTVLKITVTDPDIEARRAGRSPGGADVGYANFSTLLIEIDSTSRMSVADHQAVDIGLIDDLLGDFVENFVVEGVELKSRFDRIRSAHDLLIFSKSETFPAGAAAEIFSIDPLTGEDEPKLLGDRAQKMIIRFQGRRKQHISPEVVDILLRNIVTISVDSSDMGTNSARTLGISFTDLGNDGGMGDAGPARISNTLRFALISDPSPRFVFGNPIIHPVSDLQAFPRVIFTRHFRIEDHNEDAVRRAPGMAEGGFHGAAIASIRIVASAGDNGVLINPQWFSGVDNESSSGFSVMREGIFSVSEAQLFLRNLRLSIASENQDPPETIDFTITLTPVQAEGINPAAVVGRHSIRVLDLNDPPTLDLVQTTVLQKESDPTGLSGTTTVIGTADAIETGQTLSLGRDDVTESLAPRSIAERNVSSVAELFTSAASFSVVGDELRLTYGTPAAGKYGQVVYQIRVRDDQGGVSPFRQFTYTVVFEDRPVVTVAADAGAVSEGGKAAFTLTRAGGADEALTVAVSVSETGDVISDDLLTMADFTADDSTVSVSVATEDDGIDEADGAVTMTVDAGEDYDVGEASSATVTVLDDDLPLVTVSAGAGAVSEGGKAAFTLTRAGVMDEALTVAVSVSETGEVVRGTTPTAVTFAAGSGTTRLKVVTDDDGIWEEHADVTMTVKADDGYVVSATTGSATVRVLDDDVPAMDVSLVNPDIRVDEGVGTVAVEATAVTKGDEMPHGDVAVLLSTMDDAALSGEDYEAVRTTGVFSLLEFTAATMNGERRYRATMLSFSIPIINDARDEEDEAFAVALERTRGLPAVVELQNAGGVVTIADDDETPGITSTGMFEVPENSMAITALTATDGDGDDLEWSIIGGADTRVFTLTGNGKLSFADAQDFESPGDSDGDGDYQVTVQVTDGANPVTAAITVVLQNVDESDVTIEAVMSSVTEGENAAFTLRRMRDTSEELRVAMNVLFPDGLLTPHVVLLSANVDRVTVSFETPDDDEWGEPSTVTAIVAGGMGYEVSPGSSSATVTVNNDDQPQMRVELVLQQSSSVAESIGSSTGLLVVRTVRDERPPSRVSTFAITLSIIPGDGADGARSPEDYSAVSEIVFLPSFVSVREEHDGRGFYAMPVADRPRWEITIHDDRLDEPDEPFYLMLDGSPFAIGHYIEISAVRYRVVIVDDDDPVVTVSADQASVIEGMTALFTLTRVGLTDAALTVAVSVDSTGDVIGGAAPATAVFGAGDPTVSLSVATENDDLDEPDGVVTVTVQSGDDYAAGAVSSATVTVLDDDLPRVSVSADQGVVREGGNVAFTLARMGVTSETLTVQVSVSDGAGDVIRGTTPTAVTFAAGSGTTRLAVVTDDDDVWEEHADVTMTVKADDGYAVSATTPSATVRVLDDDVPAIVVSLVNTDIKVDEDAGTVAVEVAAETREDRMPHGDSELVVSLFTNDGTAEAPGDYTALNTTVSFPVSGFTPVDVPGGSRRYRASPQTFSVALVGDARDEEDEEFVITLERPPELPAAVELQNAGGVVTIIDDDETPGITSVGMFAAPENSVAAFAILTATDGDGDDLMWLIIGGADTKAFTLTGDGKLSFSEAQDFESFGDSDVDGIYELTVQVTDGVNPAEAAIKVELEDVDEEATTAEVTVRAVADAVAEGTTALFTLTRTGSVAARLQVSVSLGEIGDVIDGDLPRMKVLTFSTKLSVLELGVATEDDELDEADGAVTVTVGGGEGYAVGATPSATVAVLDNDGLVTMELTAESLQLRRDASAQVVVELSSALLEGRSATLALSVAEGDGEELGLVLPSRVLMSADGMSVALALSATRAAMLGVTTLRLTVSGDGIAGERALLAVEVIPAEVSLALSEVALREGETKVVLVSLSDALVGEESVSVSVTSVNPGVLEVVSLTVPAVLNSEMSTLGVTVRALEVSAPVMVRLRAKATTMTELSVLPSETVATVRPPVEVISAVSGMLQLRRGAESTQVVALSSALLGSSGTTLTVSVDGGAGDGLKLNGEVLPFERRLASGETRVELALSADRAALLGVTTLKLTVVRSEDAVPEEVLLVVEVISFEVSLELSAVEDVLKTDEMAVVEVSLSDRLVGEESMSVTVTSVSPDVLEVVSLTVPAMLNSEKSTLSVTVRALEVLAPAPVRVMLRAEATTMTELSVLPGATTVAVEPAMRAVATVFMPASVTLPQGLSAEVDVTTEPVLRVYESLVLAFETTGDLTMVPETVTLNSGSTVVAVTVNAADMTGTVAVRAVPSSTTPSVNVEAAPSTLSVTVDPAMVTVQFTESTLTLTQQNTTGTATVTTVPGLAGTQRVEVRLAVTAGLAVAPGTVTLTKSDRSADVMIGVSGSTTEGSVVIESVVGTNVTAVAEAGEEFGVLNVIVSLVRDLQFRIRVFLEGALQ